MNETERAALVEELESAVAGRLAVGIVLNRLSSRELDCVKTGDEIIDKAIMPVIDRLLADRAVPEPDADAIYRERNQVVAALSKCFYSWIGTVDDAEPGWTKAVYIDLPSGQVSWHVSDDEVQELFGHLQVSGELWDGHTTEEKYRRLSTLEADAPVSDIDAMLAGEDPDVIIIDKTHIAPTEYRAHLYDRGSSWQLTGTGSTRNEAVANALKGGAS